MKLAVGLLAIALVAPSASNAQRATDSAAIRKLAERAQVRFERIRKLNLPERYPGRRDECDARIGRFCQWNSKDDTVAARENRAVVRGRVSLLATLDSLSRKSPHDGWITGQRIRYLLEAGDDSTTVTVAENCAGSGWWCDALRGLAFHEAGSAAAADSAFALALGAMPEAERCRWTDMTPLLDANQRKRYGKVGCGKNDDAAARLWWLADPFLSVAGNDRQAEHYSRHTMAKVLEPTRIVYNLSWANDIREMIVRYGWARYWTQGPGTSMDPNGGVISGHEATPNYHFIPVSMPLDSLHEIAFDLDEEKSAERYAPVAANRLSEISPQIALFRRGDSVRVVAAFDVSMRKPFDSSSVQSALVLAPDEKSSVIDSGSFARGSFAVTIDSRPHVLSLEVLSIDHRHAAWKRSGVWLSPRKPNSVDVSDVLLFAPAGREVGDLESAMQTALPEDAVTRGKLGMYWEIYGLARGDSALPVSLTLTPVERSALRRLSESIGLAQRTSPLNIAWRDTPGAESVSARSVVLDFSLVPRGRYELRVEVRPAGQAAASSTRTIQLQ